MAGQKKKSEVVEPTEPVEAEQEAVEKPAGSFTVEFYYNQIKVTFDGFEKLSPSKIQQSFDFVQRAWQTRRQQEINSKRRSGNGEAA